MKLQIDTENKIIKIEEIIILKDLIETLNNLFPNESWKEYKLDPSIINNFTNPIIIKDIITHPYNPYPVTYPWINPTWCKTDNYIGDGNNNFQQIYNLEITN